MVASSLPTNLQPALQLRDIHLPPPITWWPVAPGWYMLMVILLLGMGGIIYLFLFHKRQRVKREALGLLARYELSYQQGLAVEIVCAQISELLRRVAIYYYPRENIAGLQGEAWLKFLQDTPTDVALLRVYLLEKPYQAVPQENSSAQDIDAFFKFSKQWICRRKHRV